MSTGLFIYTMVGTLPASQNFEPVYWQVYNTPDLTGAKSGYPGLLSNISIATTYEVPNAQQSINSPVGPATGDLGGIYPNPTVVGLQGVPINNTAPINGQTLIYDSIDGYYRPNAIPGFPIIGVPLVGQTLVYSNAGWVPNGLYSIVVVTSYGALGNGSHDDTSAINAAIAAASAAGGGGIYFPTGNYKITSAITITSSDVRLFGNGVTSTTITQTTPGQSVFEITDAADVVISEMSIIGNSAADAVFVTAVANALMFRPTLRNVNITGFGVAGKAISVSGSTINCTNHGLANGTRIKFSGLVAAQFGPNPTFSTSGNLVTITGHGLVAGDPIQFNDNASGTLPSGVSAFTVYYVLASGLTANSFKISTSAGGSVLTFTGTGATYTLVQTWTVVPQPLNAYNTYYVVNKSTNSFQVALVSGGAPITLTGAATSTVMVGQVFAGIHINSNGQNVYDPRLEDVFIDGNINLLTDGGARVGILVDQGPTLTNVVVHCSVIAGEISNLHCAVNAALGSEIYMLNTHIYNILDGAGGGTAFLAGGSSCLRAQNIRFETPAIDRCVFFDGYSYGNYIDGLQAFQTYQLLDSGVGNGWRLANNSNVINKQAGAYTFAYLKQDVITELTPGAGITLGGLVAKTNEIDLNQNVVVNGTIRAATNPLIINRSDNAGAKFIIDDTQIKAFGKQVVYNGGGSAAGITLDGDNEVIIYGTITQAYGSAAPVSGSYIKGSIVFNSSMTVGQPILWTCTVSGTPGTWVAGPTL